MKTMIVTVDDVTLTKIQLWAVGALFVSKSESEKIVLKDLIDWAGTTLNTLKTKAHGPAISNLLVADILDGIRTDDPKFEILRMDLITMLRTKPEPPPPPPPPPPPTVEPLPSANLLAPENPSPWLDGTLGSVNPEFEPRLMALVKGLTGRRVGRLIIADTDCIPSRMDQAGFHVRETAAWYWLSRVYAGWDTGDPSGDGDGEFMASHKSEINDFWQRYLDMVGRALQAAPDWSALLIANDGHDHCGRTLGDYSMRGLPDDVRGRVEMGDVVPD